MQIKWRIDSEDVARVKTFIDHQSGNPFVKYRIATNLKDHKPPVSIEVFWQRMIGCLLTTQQRSGPNSHVSRFIATNPFLLRYEACQGETNLEVFITRTLTEFGGLRRSTTIGTEARRNAEYLKADGWKETSAILDEVRLNSNVATERKAARFIQRQFEGFGPKQSRNLLQALGLSRFEIPIDSRITKWLNKFGFPVHLNSKALADQDYYEFVSDGFQQLAVESEIFPCVLDAAIFASFDGDEWTEQNASW